MTQATAFARGVGRSLCHLKATMLDRLAISQSLRSAALISAAFIMFFAAGALMTARVAAQVPTRIEGQLFNGTKGVPPASVVNVPVTLFQITQAGPVTRTVQSGADGKFAFDNLTTNATSFFTQVNYEGIRYYSDIRPAEIAAAQPITLTLYETQTLPADFAIDRAHFVLDVGLRRLDGLVFLQIIPPGDRAFMMPLPIPDGTSDVQFQDVREQSRIVRAEDGTVLYPVLPTTSEVLYGITLPVQPPDSPFILPLRTNVSALNLLIAQVGGAQITGAGLTAGQPFSSQNGQVYNVASAGPQRAGTTFTALVSNLPGVDNTRAVQNVVLVVGGVGALLLLSFPFYRRRASKD